MDIFQNVGKIMDYVNGVYQDALTTLFVSVRHQNTGILIGTRNCFLRYSTEYEQIDQMIQRIRTLPDIKKRRAPRKKIER